MCWHNHQNETRYPLDEQADQNVIVFRAQDYKTMDAVERLNAVFRQSG